MPPHARDVVSNSAIPRTSLPHISSDLVQPSKGFPRVFVVSPGASSILPAPALMTIYAYLMMVTKSMQPVMSVIFPTRTAMTVPCSRLRTWVGTVSPCADGHSACLGRLVVLGERCMIFFYSRACSESISILVCTYLTVAHIRQMDRTSHPLFDYSLCRLADHTILPYPYIIESKRNPARCTRVLSYVGGLHHLWSFRFLHVNVV